MKATIEGVELALKNSGYGLGRTKGGRIICSMSNWRKLSTLPFTRAEYSGFDGMLDGMSPHEPTDIERAKSVAERIISQKGHWHGKGIYFTETYKDQEPYISIYDHATHVSLFLPKR